MAPASEIGTLDYLKLMQANLESRIGGLETRMTTRLDEMGEQLSELQRCGLEQSHTTLTGRAECQRIVTERLDRLEKRDLLTMVWEQRKAIVGLLVAFMGIVGVMRFPAILPVLDQVRRLVP